MKLQHLALAAVAVPTLLASCIDNTWDLSDIDMTIGTNADLTLPTSSTGNIVLRNLLDLEDDGVVKMVKDGVILTNDEYDALSDAEKATVTYVVSETGSANIDPIKIDPITITRPEINAFTTYVQRSKFGMSNARKAAGKKARGAKAPITVNVDLSRVNPMLPSNYTVEIATKEYGYTIQPTDNTDYNISGAKADNVSEDIIALKNATISGATASIELGRGNINFGNATEITKIHFDNFRLSYPKGLNVEKATFTYNGKQHETKIDNEAAVVTLTEGLSEPMDIAQPINLELTFDKAIVGQDIAFDADAHTVEITGKFRVDGAFRIVTDDMDKAIIEQKVNSADPEKLAKMVDLTDPTNPVVTLDLDELGLIPTEVKVTGDANFKSDISIETVSGTFCHEVGDFDPIMLDDLPDFLNDDDVVLDLENPLVFITAMSSLPAVITIGQNATSKGLALSADGKEYSTGQLTVNKGENYFKLSEKNSNIVPSNYKGKNVEWREVKGLPDLIKDVPNEIDVTVDPVYLDATDIEINHEYPLSVDYEVYAPLEFGDDFLLVYSDSERDFAKDLEDVEDLDLGHIELKAKIDSDLPADISFSLVPIDKNGRKIEALKDVAIDVPANAKNHDINITIEATGKYTINDVLTGSHGAQQLDGVTYRAEVKKGTEGDTTLRPEAKVRLHDINLTIKGGVSYDAN